MLKDHLQQFTSVTNVTVGKPEPASSIPATSRLNLFLYELHFDPHLRNQPLDDNQPPPLWLSLKFLITAFDNAGESDSIEAHEFLGDGLRALGELAFLPLPSVLADPAGFAALQPNPEVMKITLDNATTELLSKVMQGTDEKYRFSAAFEVRPVLIAPSTPPSSSLLVGVDYTAPAIIGEDGIHIDVFPIGGPEVDSIEPPTFEPNGEFVLRGSDMNLPGLSVRIGSAEAPVIAQAPDWLRCRANGSIATGAVISAGSQPIAVAQTLPNGKQRLSNYTVGRLQPVLTAVTPPAGGFTRLNPADPLSPVFGNIDLTGLLLGTEDDAVYLALTRNDNVVRVIDSFARPPAPVPPNPIILQQQMQLQIPSTNPIPQGRYRFILRANGSQAKNSPELDIVA
jgi:hypothetical protein